MALIVCPLCVREDDVFLLRTLPDGRKEARCDDCDFVFAFGSPVEPKKATATAAPRRRTAAPRATRPSAAAPIAVAARRFPTVADVDASSSAHVEELKQAYLATPYEPRPLVDSHWAKFRWVFGADGLEKAAVFDLQRFAGDPIGGSTGDTAAFDKAWVLLGELEGARRIRAMVNRLLRGPGDLEDRLTELAGGNFAMAMPGWDEAVLTKTLAVAEPLRFLPVYTYADKAALALSVYGLELPVVDASSLTLGRLAVWSNDLLVELLGDGFDDLHHAAGFLRWAATQ